MPSGRDSFRRSRFAPIHFIVSPALASVESAPTLRSRPGPLGHTWLRAIVTAVDNGFDRS
jgi:hypothetical protein